MAQISEHINSPNHKINSYDQIIKMIVNLVSKKVIKNGNYYCQLNHLQNSLIMSILYTPEEYLFYFDGKY